jgi:glycogen synthase
MLTRRRNAATKKRRFLRLFAPLREISFMNTQTPARILMTADTVGGVWTYALELARALQPYGIEVLLAVMGTSLSDAQTADARSISNLNLFKSNYKLEWMPDCWSDVRHAGDWLLHLENRLQPDLVHLNGYAHGSLPWNSPTLVVGHSCVYSWWQAVKGDTPPIEWQQYKTEVMNGLAGADLVVTPSAAMMHALNAHYGPLENTRVIPNGRNPADFTSRSKRKFILSAGRLWDEAKNIDRLVDIACELPWPVVVAGDLQDRPHPRRCQWLGSLPESELRRWFAAASVYALPALYEPFGYTPLEAALSGCALVLGDISSLREIWHDAAVFVDPNDSRALRAALLELIENPAHRQEMSQRARERAVEFTSDRMGQNYFAAYVDVLEAQTNDLEEKFAQCV